jgi:hypothetical protein
MRPIRASKRRTRARRDMLRIRRRVARQLIHPVNRIRRVLGRRRDGSQCAELGRGHQRRSRQQEWPGRPAGYRRVQLVEYVGPRAGSCERQGIAGKQKRAASQALKTRPIAAIISVVARTLPPAASEARAGPRGGSGVVSSNSDAVISGDEIETAASANTIAATATGRTWL